MKAKGESLKQSNVSPINEYFQEWQNIFFNDFFFSAARTSPGPWNSYNDGDILCHNWTWIQLQLYGVQHKHVGMSQTGCNSS